ncbi:hypothetical protein H4582DRAFT_1950621 [Lactarius indigo]|nr:hypothetical protein H4582DRAFT_1950621 [Lactarius indigo]
MMSGFPGRIADPERGDSLPLDELRGGEARGEATNNSSESLPRAESHKERRDFGDGANALWSLFAKQAKTQDEARFQSLVGDMEGVLVFAGLFSAVLTSFLGQSIQKLQPDPTQQSAYYQNQSLAVLIHISQQIATIGSQVSNPSITPPPYLPPKPSSSDILVNVCWLISLVCSLSAAFLAILIQQWVRSYMQVFQLYDHPLKRARFRQFFFEGAKGMPALAEAVPGLIHLSLFLFFIGLGDSILNISTTVGVTTIVPICICGSFYLYTVLAPVWNPQSPYRNPYSVLILYAIRRFYYSNHFLRTGHAPRSMEADRGEPAMEETEERKNRDVRAIRWLVDNTTVNVETERFVLAIPGSFDTEWGLKVWREVSTPGSFLAGMSEPWTNRPLAGDQVSFRSNSPHPPEGTTVYTISRCVRYLFETCNNHNSFENEEARRRRMRACVEAAVSLICRIQFQLEWFGEVSRLVSEIGHIEKINELRTSRSDPSFTIPWTCLSLMATPQILTRNNDRLRVFAVMAVGGLARFQSEYGKPDEAAQKSARRIDSYLTTAWGLLEDLRRAFEPWGQERSREDVKALLRDHKAQISQLERIAAEVGDLEDIDWRISLLQDAMDDAGHRLMRQLPGVSFSELQRDKPPSISEVFNFPSVGTTPIAPQLIFPGQQLQALATLGVELREVLEGGSTEADNAVLESLKCVDNISTPLRRLNNPMMRQLWRLQDLRDGNGLGFTIELFFLTVRQLLSTSAAQDSNEVFFRGTFEVITSRWMENKQSLGTQHTLLNLACDLVIRGRGVFSDFDFPTYITDMLFELVGVMIDGYTGSSHMNDVQRELEDESSRNRMDMRLRSKALAAIRRRNTTSS